MEYYVYVGDDKFTRNATKVEYRYANAWRDVDGNVSVTWHTTLNAANTAYDRRKHNAWLNREECVGYLSDVYSAERTPPTMFDGYRVSISLNAEGQEAWKKTFGLGHDRQKLRDDLQAYFEESVTTALEGLHILKEIPGLRLEIKHR
jgi:hypothetical protein